MKSQLLSKRSGLLNEELARPGAGTDCFEQEYQYDNPFANKRNEENAVKATIETHREPRMLPPREGERKHYDSEAQAEIEKEKAAKVATDPTPETPKAEAPAAEAPKAPETDWVQLAKGMTATEARYLKLILRKSGQDPIQAIFPFSGAHNVKQFLLAVNALAHKGWFEVKDNKPFKTETTERLVETYDAVRSGAVVASVRWKSFLLW